MITNKTELLAPCGTMESFYAALAAGADAVYLGGTKFGARAYAGNFTDSQLAEVLYTAHCHDLRVYLTVNTLIKQNEINQVTDYLSPLSEAGLDGVIVQDLGVLSLLHRTIPDLQLHASTQLQVTSHEAASVLKDFGVTRIVPARELTLEECRSIKEKTGLEIEVFIHGAMCYCYSGRCLMSSMIGGRSGNRGRCAQPCRLPYTSSYSTKPSYPLSMRDMQTIDILPSLLDAGMDSLKIEGRMKPPEYVAGVVSAYRKAIDAYYDGSPVGVSDKEKEVLRHLYIRGEVSTGYFDGKRGKQLLSMESPGYVGTEEEILSRIRSTYCKEPVKHAYKAHFEANTGLPLHLFVYDEEGAYFEVYGEVPETAKSVPTCAEEIKSQLNKLGDMPFTFEEITVTADDNLFIPKKWVNALRRSLCAQILHFDKEAANTSETPPVLSVKQKKTTISVPKSLRIHVKTSDQAKAVLSFLKETSYPEGAFTVTFDADALMKDSLLLASYQSLNGAFSRGICLPVVLREREDDYKQKLLRLLQKEAPEFVYVSDIASFGFLMQYTHEYRICTEPSLYAWNDEAMKYFARYAAYISLPWELSSGEIRNLCDNVTECLSKLESIVYGRPPLMVSSGCLSLTSNHCGHGEQGNKAIALKDRKNHVFPVETSCEHCTNVILNDLPVCLYDGIPKLLQDGIERFTLLFTVETGDQALQVTKAFCQKLFASNEKSDSKSFSEIAKNIPYTSGWFKRPAE